MIILGIETSCDETAVAIVQDGTKILSNVVVSQIDIFAAYGGVIPEVAARNHLDAILPVIHKAFSDAGFVKGDHDDWDKIDAIAVTHTPGLLGSLLIGTLTARTLAILHDKPLYAVHHLKSHIYANWLSASRPEFPLLALVISGGHTQIIHMSAHNHFEIIGTTHDDAIGECFDKVAKILGLPYPGGPSIAKAALSGDRHKYHFPHPKVNGLDFSFSGLKTAVLRAVQKELNLPISHPSHDLKNHLSAQQISDFAASFEQTAVDILLEKLSLAHSEHPDAQSIVFAGGVSANGLLRKEAMKLSGVEESFSRNMFVSPGHESSNSRLSTVASATSGYGRKPTEFDDSDHGAEQTVVRKTSSTPLTFFPNICFSGDNGAMVAAACFFEISSGVSPTGPYHLDLLPRSAIK